MTWLRDTIREGAKSLFTGAGDEAGREIVRKIKAKWQSRAKPKSKADEKENVMTTTIEDLMRRAAALECRLKFTDRKGKVEFSQFDSTTGRDAPIIARVQVLDESQSGVSGYGEDSLAAVRDLCANLEDELRKRIKADQKALNDAGGS